MNPHHTRLITHLRDGGYDSAARTMSYRVKAGTVRSGMDLYEGGIHLKYEQLGDGSGLVRDTFTGEPVATSQGLVKRKARRKRKSTKPKTDRMTNRGFRASDSQVEKFEETWGENWRIRLRELGEAHCDLARGGR